jgi:O-antigen/teichoic acid export membrane protein
MVDVSNLYNKIVQGSILIFIGNVFGAGAAFVTRAFAARYLGNSDYGLIILGISSLNILSLLVILGLDQGVARQIPREPDQSKLFFSSLYLVMAIGTSCAVLLYLIASPVATSLNKPLLAPVLKLFSVGLPLMAIFRLLIGGFRGCQDPIGKVIIQNFIYQGGTLILLAGGAYLGANLYGIALSWIVALFASISFGVLLMRKRTELFSGSFKRALYAHRNLDIGRLRYMIAFSIPLMASQGLWTLINQFDNFILAYFLPSSSVGVYDASFTLSRVILLIIWVVSYLVLPIFSNLHSDGKYEEMNRIYRLITKWMAFAVLPLYLTFIFYPNKVLNFTFGSEYASGSFALFVLSTGFVINVLIGANKDALIAVGITRRIMWGNIFALIVNFTLNILLIPIYGIGGAAIASGVAYAAVNLYWFGLLHKKTGVQPLYPQYVIPMIGSLLGSITMFKVVSRFMPSVSPIFVLVGICLIHTISIIILGGVENEDYKFAIALINR